MTEHVPVNPDSDSQVTEASAERLFATLMEAEPKPIASFVPENAAEQKELFLSGKIDQPRHVYSKLNKIDFPDRYRDIQLATEGLKREYQDEPLLAGVYEQYGDRYMRTTRLMEIATELQHAHDDATSQALSAEYRELNVGLYGEPSETVYRSLVKESLNALRSKTYVGKARHIYDELIDMTPRSVEELSAERFRPSPETIEWAGEVVQALYGGFLSHIPDGVDEFSDNEAKDVFQSILDSEFFDQESGVSAAEGWKAVVGRAQSVNVKAGDKNIVIPEGRSVSRSVMRGLVVHEVGVHVLRSIMGEQTQISALKTGLANYYDSEEGLGAVAEQALKGKYRVAGEGHYVTVGLAYFDNKDFRETFEVKWRLSALQKVGEDGQITDEQIAASRSAAYGSTMRIFRGTDSLPFLKDLAYYNGADAVWRYLEDHRGDDTYVALLFLGKADPTLSTHRRVLFESHTS